MAVLCWRRVGCRRLTSFTPARISYISLVCFTRVGAHMSCRRSWRRALRSVQMYGKCVRTYVRPAIFRDRNAPIICVQEHARTFSASYNPNENRRIIRMCRAASERTMHVRTVQQRNAKTRPAFAIPDMMRGELWVPRRVHKRWQRGRCRCHRCRTVRTRDQRKRIPPHRVREREMNNVALV